MHTAARGFVAAKQRYFRSALALALIGSLTWACVDDQGTTGPTPDGFSVPMLTPLSNCSTGGGTVDGFTKNYACGINVVVKKGTGWTTGEATAVTNAISSATGSWNSVMGTYGLPTMVANTGTGTQLTINMLGGSGSYYCGQATSSTNINIGRFPGPAGQNGTCTNPAQIGNIASLFVHEMGHAIGFSSTVWHKAGPDSVTGNCAVQLMALAPLNGSPCIHEREALFTAYGISGRPQPDRTKYYVTGVEGVYGGAIQTGADAGITLSRVSFAYGNAKVYGPGCSPEFEGTCLDRLDDISISWSSSNSSVLTVAGVDARHATVHPVGAGTADVIATISVPSGIFEIGSELAANDYQVRATYTVTVPAVASVTITGGNNQSGQVHTTLPVPIKIKALTSGGAGVAGVPVTFSILTGGGSVSPVTVNTNAQGEASANWTLGNGAGTQTAKATVAGSGITGNPATFTATAVAGPAAMLAIIDGDEQTAIRGTTLPVDPTVQVQDAYGNGVTGTTVQFAVTVGGGTVTPASDVSDASGLASTSWTLGFPQGEQDMTATVTGLTPVTFTATSVRTFPLGGFELMSCSSYPYGGKTYNDFTVSWTGGSGSWEIGEATTNNSAAAVVIQSGTGTTSAVIGSYLASGTPSYRYWWIRNAGSGTWVALASNPTNVSQCLQ